VRSPVGQRADLAPPAGSPGPGRLARARRHRGRRPGGRPRLGQARDRSDVSDAAERALGLLEPIADFVDPEVGRPRPVSRPSPSSRRPPTSLT